jgi:hypothetical protein
MGFRADLDEWLSDQQMDIAELKQAALTDPEGFDKALDDVPHSEDEALIRVFAVVQVLNEILADKKRLPETLAEVIVGIRRALAAIARNAEASSYILTLSTTPPRLTIGVTFAAPEKE